MENLLYLNETTVAKSVTIAHMRALVSSPKLSRALFVDISQSWQLPLTLINKCDHETLRQLDYCWSILLD